MKTAFKNPIVVAVVAFFIGGATFWTAQEIFHRTHRDQFFDQSRDPFADMNRLHHQMLKSFSAALAEPESEGLNIWPQKNFETSHTSDFKVREDGDFVYYEISSDQGVPRKVDVKVDHDQIIIRGEIENKNESQDAAAEFISTFVRSFPAPDNVDARKFQLENRENTVVVKFPKIKGAQHTENSETA